MNARIKALTEKTLAGEMFAVTTKVEFDRNDIFLSEEERDVKRLCEYILAQEPVLTEYQTMTGFFNFNGSVIGDAFHRSGHRHFNAVKETHYLKSVDNLSTLEWQHATADYEAVLAKGISGLIADIDRSLAHHTAPDEVAFLVGLKRVAETMILWARKCAERALALAEKTENAEHAKNLRKLGETLLRVPEKAPESFYEAVLTIYVCFAADPDSVGTLDRYLASFYFEDIKNGVLARDEAKAYLQEFFLMLQATAHPSWSVFTRGGESHFCIGGYLPDGTDGFTDLSDLILEALVELPTYIPQVTVRWTAKMPREVFRHAMDMERRDPHKRIAFQNDEKRIKCYTEICGFPYEEAVRYTTVGCNEPTFPGTIKGSTSNVNIARSMERLFSQKAECLAGVTSFEAFYEIYMKELFADLEEAYALDNSYNAVRARDNSYVSSLFFRGCIEKAKSLTRGTADFVVAGPSYMGITNVIDSLIVVKQFVFDEKLFSLSELAKALQANWQGYEEWHTLIKKKGDFFGNDTERSNTVARAFYATLYEHLKDKTNLFGYHFLIGDLTGYNEHFKWYGAKTAATPDGRRAGDPLKFGIGQSGGYDREGLSALLHAIATVDPNAIGCGSTVTNVTVDEQLIKNDENFEKTVDMFEAYFKEGGVHFQLNYVSKEDLLAAKETPEEHKNLRVRVSGFSDYFVKLNDGLQEDVIKRTSHCR
ncbi:MAG: hypothetical protein J6W28_08960 [Clostridia bacterium]|nr:hypothetical protein [Clostridia bacterium]